MLNKKNASILVVLLTVAGLLGTALFPSSRGASSSTSSESSSAPGRRASGPDGAGSRATAVERDLTLGATFTYEVRASHAVSAGGKTLTSTDVGGRLALEIVGAVDGGAAVRAVLSDVSRSDVGAHASVPAAAALSTPFFFVLRPDGAIASVHFVREMPGDARRQVRALASALQLTAAPGGAAEWQASELDGSGQFIASYTRAGDRVEKTKARYELIRTPAGLVTPRSIGTTFETRGKTTMTIAPSGWPASVDEDAAIVAVLSSGRMEMTVETRARLVASARDKSHAGSFEAARASFDPDTDAMAEGAALARRNADESLVGGATYADLLSKLGRAVPSSERNQAIGTMSALFKTRPESVAQARAALLDVDTSSDATGALTAALGGAGTPAAQRALADTLLAKNVSDQTKSAAAMSLGFVRNPTPEARAALHDAMGSQTGDVADTATLAMGSLIRADGQSGADTSDAVATLVSKLATATTAGERALLLDALGNSGDPRAEEAIVVYLGDADATVRASAFGALRFLASARAVHALAIGAQDVEPAVRQAAVSAMAHHDAVPFLPVLASVLSSDAEATVRLVAVHVLARSVNTTPEVETLLSRTASNDHDAQVRAAAAAALSRPVAR